MHGKIKPSPVSLLPKVSTKQEQRRLVNIHQFVYVHGLFVQVCVCVCFFKKKGKKKERKKERERELQKTANAVAGQPGSQHRYGQGLGERDLLHIGLCSHLPDTPTQPLGALWH